MNNAKPKLLVVGGSAGGLSMVLKIFPRLTPDMNLCIILVLHRKSSEDNVLVDVLAKRTRFNVKEADDKDIVTAGTLFVAPADYHLLIEKDGTITLDDSEKVNYSRPSIDVTFESAGEAYHDSLVCLLLSGANADGVAGMLKAKESGAFTVVQDPKSAEVSFMPQSALDTFEPDLVLGESNLQEFVLQLTR